MQVKTNVEYQAMLHEIEFTKKRIEDREDEILELMMDADEKEQMLQDVSGDFNQKKTEVENRKRRLEEFLSESQSELDQLEEQGIVGPDEGGGRGRQVLLGLEIDLEEIEERLPGVEPD